jgi:CRP-like cAMP-binding protein
VLISKEKPSILGLLHSNTLLNALSEAQVQQLAASSRVVHVERGEMIWSSGANIDYIGLAGTGFIKMVRSRGNGSVVTVELFGPGQIFGLMGAITGTGCPLSAVAVTDLFYLRISKAPILEIYGTSMALKDRLVRRSALRLHAQVDLYARMSTGSVEQRIASVLFVLLESYGETKGSRARLTVPLTRQEISEMAGTTVESTIRTMSKWQKSGLVATDKDHHIMILDEGRFAELLQS